jgi:hypothetical protein
VWELFLGHASEMTFIVMEIIYYGLHKFVRGTLGHASIRLFGIDEGLIPHDHLIAGCLPSYYR